MPVIHPYQLSELRTLPASGNRQALLLGLLLLSRSAYGDQPTHPLEQQRSQALEAFILSDALKSQLGRPNIQLEILEREGTTAAIRIKGGSRSLGLLYYLHAEGWHLRRPGEQIVHDPELDAWVIRPSAR